MIEMNLEQMHLRQDISFRSCIAVEYSLRDGHGVQLKRILHLLFMQMTNIPITSPTTQPKIQSGHIPFFI